MTEGKKFDQGKLLWHLLPNYATEAVVQCLTYGANKYEEDNWKLVKNPKKRYLAAALRHLWEYKKGFEIDHESGLPHIAHAICCLLFLLGFQVGDATDVDSSSPSPSLHVPPAEQARSTSSPRSRLRRKSNQGISPRPGPED